jgi:hypothetical protein
MRKDPAPHPNLKTDNILSVTLVTAVTGIQHTLFASRIFGTGEEACVLTIGRQRLRNVVTAVTAVVVPEAGRTRAALT